MNQLDDIAWDDLLVRAGLKYTIMWKSQGPRFDFTTLDGVSIDNVSIWDRETALGFIYGYIIAKEMNEKTR